MCPECGKAWPGRWRFCGHCGAALHPRTTMADRRPRRRRLSRPRAVLIAVVTAVLAGLLVSVLPMLRSTPAPPPVAIPEATSDADGLPSDLAAAMAATIAAHEAAEAAAELEVRRGLATPSCAHLRELPPRLLRWWREGLTRDRASAVEVEHACRGERPDLHAQAPG